MRLLVSWHGEYHLKDRLTGLRREAAGVRDQRSRACRAIQLSENSIRLTRNRARLRPTSPSKGRRISFSVRLSFCLGGRICDVSMSFVEKRAYCVHIHACIYAFLFAEIVLCGLTNPNHVATLPGVLRGVIVVRVLFGSF